MSSFDSLHGEAIDALPVVLKRLGTGDGSWPKEWGRAFGLRYAQEIIRRAMADNPGDWSTAQQEAAQQVTSDLLQHYAGLVCRRGHFELDPTVAARRKEALARKIKKLGASGPMLAVTMLSATYKRDNAVTRQHSVSESPLAESALTGVESFANSPLDDGPTLARHPGTKRKPSYPRVEIPAPWARLHELAWRRGQDDDVPGRPHAPGSVYEEYLTRGLSAGTAYALCVAEACRDRATGRVDQTLAAEMLGVKDARAAQNAIDYARRALDNLDDSATVAGILVDLGVDLDGPPSGNRGWVRITCPWHGGTNPRKSKAYYHPGLDLFHCFRVGGCVAATGDHALSAQGLLAATSGVPETSGSRLAYSTSSTGYEGKAA